MVAGLFAAHGVFVGKTRPITPFNPKGNFEGSAVSSVLGPVYGPLVSVGSEAPPVRGLKKKILDALSKAGYAGGPWLWKGSAMYWQAFCSFDPHWITVRRSDAAILQSNKSFKRMGGAPQHSLRAHNAVLDKLEAAGASRVDAAALITHDFRQIRKAFERCGLAFNERIAREWIDPTLWHC